METPQSWDRWTWEKSKTKILTLPGRLGFPKGSTLRFLGLEVNLNDGSVTDAAIGQPFDPKIEYIFFLLNRYAEAKDIPLTGDFITYKHISGGRVYFPVFEGRVVKPIEKHLGPNPDLFTKAAEHLQGTSTKLGDIAYTITTFPRVPLIYALWKADDEFPPRVKVYLDSTAGSYLDAEALAHLGSLATLRLLSAAKL
ncbi:MAG: DUF3786 domain-containing protein [Promethearchaeota archaeon]